MMRTVLLKELNRTVALTLLATVALVGVFWTVDLAHSATTSSVTVSATVTNTVSCSSDQSSTSFGTLSSLVVSTSTPNVVSNLSCNSGGGCTLNVQDAGNTSSPGLYAAAATSSPIILSSTATLSAGTEGYGIQATNTPSGSGAVLTVNATYLHATSTLAVGGLTIANAVLASSILPISNRQVAVAHAVAISGLTKAGAYADTITYSCTGN